MAKKDLSRSVALTSYQIGDTGERVAHSDRARPVTFSLRESDIDLLKYIQGQMGYTASDALRTAIRAYAQTVRLLTSPNPDS